MVLDCAIIGGGPAGLNASLVLGRAKMNAVLLDEDKPRNAVTNESHGFITRDGITPSEFKKIAKEDVKKYSSNLSVYNEQVTDINRENNLFTIRTKAGKLFHSRKVILSTGLRDLLPSVKGIQDFYGKSLFSCPFCDGWELRDKPLVVIAENENAFHLVKMVSNWSNDLLVCTNGKESLTGEQKELLALKKIKVIDDEIEKLQGENGLLKSVKFVNGLEMERAGGFITTDLKQSSSFAHSLGCKLNEMGGIETDDLGRTSVKGVYASGDSSIKGPAQLIVAAADGSKAAMGVVHDLINEDF
ncbi:NAD(P)/FAD-dependent oxidoreductase [Cytobacillus massiliigabonensis]|uniref:NAD(P)/FAD-dependent oxidoreductase n=1 Tax=Cytobacillus massiliigabonensis TaxID=1871011 RepID=UPI000C8627A2|nr:NAD(P)/FAD-dependent oxidoreductase [Cytobacillus massiliigabonensis]